MPDHVFLIGMMGAGKTTVGRAVAAELRRPFLDSDAVIVARTGLTVPELFAAGGERGFRAEERSALASVCASSVPSVIAVGGGAVIHPDTRRRLRTGGVVVWLRAQPRTLAGRLGFGDGRPLLSGDVAATIARLDAQRRPVYSSLCDLVVDVDDLAPGCIAARVRPLARTWLEQRSVVIEQAALYRLRLVDGSGSTR